jgi:large subunit ribosomal protein L5
VDPITKFFVGNLENCSKKYYQDVCISDLILKKNYTSVMQLPRLDKIILSTTSKKYIHDKKSILFTVSALELISGQKPQYTYARKSIANFKVRQGQLLGCQVVLRNNLMYNFLDKLSKIIFPRVRDYSKKRESKHSYPPLGIDSRYSQLSTYSIGFQNIMIFPELENNYGLVDNFNGLHCTLVFTNSNTRDFKLLLSGFQIPV